MNSIGNGPPHGLDSGNYAGIRWTDKSFPATRQRQGATQKPDFDYTNMGLLFPQNDPSEIVYIIDQMDHRKKFDTNVRLHMHFIQTVATLPIFKCDYRFWNNGGEVPGFTTISTADGGGAVFTFTANPILQIMSFPEIPHPDPEGISANLEMKIYRDDNLVTGDVLVKYFDYHYQMDSDGSRQEFIK